MIASGVWAGVVPLERAYASKDVSGSGATVRSELERIQYLGPRPATPEATPMAAHFELHIEQGPILENNKQKIGVVTGAQAYKWFTIEVGGRGTKPPTKSVLSKALDLTDFDCSRTHWHHSDGLERRCAPGCSPHDNPLQHNCNQVWSAGFYWYSDASTRECQCHSEPRPLFS